MLVSLPQSFFVGLAAFYDKNTDKISDTKWDINLLLIKSSLKISVPMIPSITLKLWTLFLYNNVNSNSYNYTYEDLRFHDLKLLFFIKRIMNCPNLTL